MPSIRSYNQMGPFWDWVASMEDQQASHPWFNNHPTGAEDHRASAAPPPWEAFARGWGRNFPWGANLPHRNGPGGWGRHRPGPPPPPGAEEDPSGPPPPDYDRTPVASGDEMEVGDEKTPLAEGENQLATDTEEGPARGDRAAARAARREARDARRCARKGHAGFGARGGFGHHAGRGHGRAHSFGRHGHHHGEAGEPSFGPRHGPHGRPPFPFPMGGLGGLAEMFQNQFFGQDNNSNKQDGLFKPEVDVFDTPETFVVHVSLPGAKKEDVGVHWDAEKSELAIAGVIYRPGDEEFLKTLAMDERKVGEFERNVRLGSRANPAHVDVDGITARMEDGILRVEIPKLDSGYVDIKRVDIE